MIGMLTMSNMEQSGQPADSSKTQTHHGSSAAGTAPKMEKTDP